jgi:uncharacterized MAPEG superfamily protein
MTLELQLLAFMSIFFALAWLPASVCKYQTYGWGWLLSNRSPAGLPPMPEWGQRAQRAHDNLKENFPAFAVAVLLLALSGGFTQGTRVAAAVFTAARLIHMPVYIAGAVWPRAIAWISGVLATLYLLGMGLYGMVHF